MGRMIGFQLPTGAGENFFSSPPRPDRLWPQIEVAVFWVHDVTIQKSTTWKGQICPYVC